MINVAVQLLCAFSKHEDHGVNSLALSLPRTTLGGIAIPPPAPVHLFNDVDDESVAKNLDPPQVPALVFWGDSSADAPANKKYKIARNVIVAIAYVTDAGADPKTAIADCDLFLRAQRMCLGRYNSQDKSKDFRKLNGLEVMEISSIAEQRVTAAVGQRKMWGFLEVRAIIGETFE